MKRTALIALVIASHGLIVTLPCTAANKFSRQIGQAQHVAGQKSARLGSSGNNFRNFQGGSPGTSRSMPGNNPSFTRNHLRNLTNGAPIKSSNPGIAGGLKSKGLAGFADALNPGYEPPSGIKVGGCFPPPCPPPSCPPPSCPPPSCPPPSCPPKCPPKGCFPWWPPICVTPPTCPPPYVPTVPYPVPVEVPVVVETPVVVNSPVVVPGPGPAGPVVIENVEQETRLPELAVGATVTMKAANLGEAPGQVVLQVDALILPTMVREWHEDSVVTTLPMMGLEKPVKAQMHLINAEGKPVTSLTFLLVLPPPESETAGNVEIMSASNN